MSQTLSCDEDISKLFVSNINTTEFRYWYSSMKRLTISLNAQLKSTTTMDMINVVKFESISFKVTNEVSLYKFIQVSFIHFPPNFILTFNFLLPYISRKITSLRLFQRQNLKMFFMCRALANGLGKCLRHNAALSTPGHAW